MSVSAEEVAKHNKDSDCWVIVGDQVLDVTNFLSHLDFQHGFQIKRRFGPYLPMFCRMLA